MPEIKIGADGMVVDAHTGKQVGRITNKGLELDDNHMNPDVGAATSSGNADKATETRINNDSPTNKGILPSSDDNAQKQPLNAHAVENALPSSFAGKRTKYEITRDTSFVVRFGLFEKDGRFIVIRHDAVENFPEAEACWVKFRMWSYDEELDWKNQCQEFNLESKSQFVNVNKLNERKIKRLMLDWSFAEGNDRLKLLHTDGVLSDESYNIFKGMFPNIANSIVDLMNSVLEQNQ